MSTTEDIAVFEAPDRGAKTKNWSPRRFTYGGRKFVWKSEKESSLIKRMEWETLHEYAKVTPLEGSKTGKMDDDAGEKLVWGEKGGGRGVEATMYFKGGMDQKFVEHCLASQLAKYCRVNYPANKDTRGVEATAGAASGLLALASLASI